MGKILSRISVLICTLLLVVGCSGAQGGIQRIALLAPFEGQYREVGYDAYYAVRLAMQERDTELVELLAIDDGGSESSAIERARALSSDPLVKVVIVLGNNATREGVQQAFGQTPVVIVGQWQNEPISDNAFMLASSQLKGLLSPIEQLEGESEADIVGGEEFALQQVPLLMTDLSRISVVSSASLPDENFRQRYMSSGQFVQEPGLLATLTYDAAGIALNALQTVDAGTAIATMRYEGLNGNIQFVDGYWANAPINYFIYNADGKLTPEDRAVK